MTDVIYTVALLPTKPSSDDDSGFRHSFRAQESLPLIQSIPAQTHNTTRHTHVFISICTLIYLHIYTDKHLIYI